MGAAAWAHLGAPGGGAAEKMENDTYTCMNQFKFMLLSFPGDVEILINNMYNLGEWEYFWKKMLP